MEIEIFNRKRKLSQLKRAAGKFHEYNFLVQEIAERISENFGSNIVKNFKNCLVLGDKKSILTNQLASTNKIASITESALIEELSQTKTIIDDEFIIAPQENFDLIVSNLSMHFINDLLGSLIQIKNILQKNGFFIASVFGGKTLAELRESFIVAEQKYSKFFPRISPFADAKDMAGLMQRANFAEPIAYSETITVKYETLKDILYDLRYMGEGNCLKKSGNNYINKNFYNEVEEIYKNKFSDNEGLLTTYEVIIFSGWKQ